LAGALLAVAFAFLLRGRGGDPTARAAGSGRLTPKVDDGITGGDADG
jgi:hypothetical protein